MIVYEHNPFPCSIFVVTSIGAIVIFIMEGSCDYTLVQVLKSQKIKYKDLKLSSFLSIAF